MPIAHLYDGPLDGQTHDNEFYGFRAIAVGNVEDRRLVGYRDGAPVYSYPEHVYRLESVDASGELAYRFAETRPA